jgi:hypothetical protein
VSDERGIVGFARGDDSDRQRPRVLPDHAAIRRTLGIPEPGAPPPEPCDDEEDRLP